jgi:hypothetical protein
MSSSKKAKETLVGKSGGKKIYSEKPGRRWDKIIK